MTTPSVSNSSFVSIRLCLLSEGPVTARTKDGSAHNT